MTAKRVHVHVHPGSIRYQMELVRTYVYVYAHAGVRECVRRAYLLAATFLTRGILPRCIERHLR